MRSRFRGKRTQYVYVTIGPLGVGKSTFLNALVGEEYFKPGRGAHSVTTEITIAPFEREGESVIRIAVDTPGLLDIGTGKDDENLMKITEQLRQNTNGVNVFCLFFKQGARFDTPTQDILIKLNSMFNNPNFWNHLCVVVTRVTDEVRDQVIEEFTVSQPGEPCFKECLQDFIRGSALWGNDPPEIPFFFTDCRNWQTDGWKDNKYGEEMKRFDRWACSRINPLPTSLIRQFDPIRKHQVTEHGDYVHRTDPEPQYIRVPGNPIINRVPRTRSKTYRLNGKHVEETQKTFTYTRDVDWADIITFGIAWAARKNEYTEVKTVDEIVNGPYEVTVEDSYIEEVPSGDIGEDQRIFAGYKVIETTIQRHRVKWWGYRQNVNTDTPTVEDWEITHSETHEFYTQLDGSKVESLSELRLIYQ